MFLYIARKHNLRLIIIGGCSYRRVGTQANYFMYLYSGMFCYYTGSDRRVGTRAGGIAAGRDSGRAAHHNSPPCEAIIA